MIEHEFFETHTVFPPAGMADGPSATYLHALLENSPIAIVVLDAHHRYTMCNPAFERLFQYTPSQLLSADLDALISDPEKAEEAAQVTRAVLQGTKVHTVAQRRRRDGMMVDVEIYGIPLMVEGELAGVYGLYQDVTERNKARTAFREISDQFENLQQEERRRLAQDLHDSTSQELAVLNWNLTRLMSLVGEEDESLTSLVRETKEIARKCSASIRSASYLMHPPVLRKTGLSIAIPWLVEGFEQRSGIRVRLDMTPDLGRLREEVEIAIYRVAQEGLANVLRHSGSPEAWVSLQRKSSWLELTVRDRGSSAARDLLMNANRRSGVGISSMQERVEQLGGRLTIECPVDGTTLKAFVPLEAVTHE
jgi:two-component system, NarL family, sensor kinase